MEFQKVRKNKKEFGLFEKVPFQKGLSESLKKQKGLRSFPKSLFSKEGLSENPKKQKTKSLFFTTCKKLISNSFMIVNFENVVC